MGPGALLTSLGDADAHGLSDPTSKQRRLLLANAQRAVLSRAGLLENPSSSNTEKQMSRKHITYTQRHS